MWDKVHWHLLHYKSSAIVFHTIEARISHHLRRCLDGQCHFVDCQVKLALRIGGAVITRHPRQQSSGNHLMFFPCHMYRKTLLNRAHLRTIHNHLHVKFLLPPWIPPAKIADLSPKTVAVAAILNRWLSAYVKGLWQKAIENHWQAKMTVATRWPWGYHTASRLHIVF